MSFFNPRYLTPYRHGNGGARGHVVPPVSIATIQTLRRGFASESMQWKLQLLLVKLNVCNSLIFVAINPSWLCATVGTGEGSIGSKQAHELHVCLFVVSQVRRREMNTSIHIHTCVYVCAYVCMLFCVYVFVYVLTD